MFRSLQSVPACTPHSVGVQYFAGASYAWNRDRAQILRVGRGIAAAARLLGGPAFRGTDNGGEISQKTGCRVRRRVVAAKASQGGCFLLVLAVSPLLYFSNAPEFGE